MAIIKRPDHSIRTSEGELCALISAEDLAVMKAVVPEQGLNKLTVRSSSIPKWTPITDVPGLPAAPIDIEKIKNS